MSSIPSPTEFYATAQRSLSRRDPVLRRLIKCVGPCSLRPQTDLFAALVRAIVAQQISTKAAASIFARLHAGACAGALTPAVIVRCSDEELRGAGLSAAKVRSLRHLAEQTHSGALLLDALEKLADEEVIAQLLPVRGIGRWTAQMFLIFSLGRPDVLPVDDFGLRAAVKRHYALADLPDRGRLEELGAKWTPYRSIATWYMWRSLDSAIVKPEKD